MPAPVRSGITAAVSEIPAAERDDFVSQSLRLVEDMSSLQRYRSIEILSEMSADEREGRVDRTATELALNREQGLGSGLSYQKRLLKLLETPLDAPFPPFCDDKVALGAAGGGGAAAGGGGGK